MFLHPRGSTFLPPIHVWYRWPQNRPVVFVPVRGRSRVALLLQSAQYHGIRLVLIVRTDSHRHRPSPAQRSATQRNLLARATELRTIFPESFEAHSSRLCYRSRLCSSVRASRIGSNPVERVGAWVEFGLKRNLLGRKRVKTSCLAEPDQWTFVTIVTKSFGQKDYLVVSMYATSAM